MTKVVLPRLNQTGANEWADVQTNDEAITQVVNGELANENLSGAAGITAANLVATIGSELKGFKVGVVSATENLVLSETYADMVGAKLEITPTVSSKMLVVASFTKVEGIGATLGSLKLDSNATEETAASWGPANNGTASQVYLLSLTAALHTIKLQARRVTGASAATMGAVGTRFIYVLFSA